MTELKRLFIVDQNLKDLIGHHFEYDRSVTLAAQRSGWTVECFGHKDALPIIVDGLPFRGVFSKDMWWEPKAKTPLAATKAANRLFAKELNTALKSAAVGPNDLVFAHMIVRGQLDAWADWVERNAANGSQVVLLLRYQPEYYEGSLCEQAFRRMEACVKRGARLRLSTDSARLAGQLMRLTSLPVEVFPIPHTSEASGLSGPQIPRKSRRVLEFVSLGNARDEKGILELFAAARILCLRGQQDRAKLVLQINSPNAEIAGAVARFAHDPPPNVELIDRPLSTEAYQARLHAADVIATPYWSSIYEARTSGVFLEAIAAGKPVICTAKTWMADELVQHGAGVVTPDQDSVGLADAIIKACDTFDELNAKAQADRARIFAKHNPENFLNVLIEGSGEPPIIEMRVAILYPWGDAEHRATGASTRLGQLSDLLSPRADRLLIFQDGEPQRKRSGNIELEGFPLLGRTEKTLWFRTLRWFARTVLRTKNGEEIYALLHLAPHLDKGFQERLAVIARSSDIIFLEYPFWARALRALKPKAKIVLTAHDVISDQCRSSSLLRNLTRRLERRGLAAADEVVSLAQKDAEAFESWGIPTRVIGGGMDVAFWRQPWPLDTRSFLNRLCGLPEGDQRPFALFIGSDFLPNRQAAQRLRTMAEADQGSHPLLMIVAGRCHAKERSNNFIALGPVDTFVLHLLYSHCLCVTIPLEIGTGVSFKTLEALAAGVPVLSTPVGARGIGPELLAGCIVATDLSEWPALLDRLRLDRTFRDHWREAARVAGDALDYKRALSPYLTYDPRLMGQSPAVEPSQDRFLELLYAAADTAKALGLNSTARKLIEDVQVRSLNDPKITALVLQLGDRDSQTGALARLDQAIADGADPAPLLLEKARNYEAAGAHHSARAAYRQAAQLLVEQMGSGAKLQALREQAWAAYHTGQRSWVRALAREMTFGSQTSQAADFYYLLASTEVEASDCDPAIATQAARRAGELGFDPFWTLHVLGLAADKDGASVETFQTLMDRAYAAAADKGQRDMVLDAFVAKAWRLFEARDRRGAEAMADVCLTRDTHCSAAFYVKAEAARLDGRLDQARELYAQAAETGFDPGWCHAHIGQVLIALNKPDEAIAALVMSLKAAGTAHRADATQALESALWELYNGGERQGLLPQLESAAQLEITAPSLDYLRGECLVDAGDQAGAVRWYTEALEGGFDAYWSRRRRAEAMGGSAQAYKERLLAAQETTDDQKRAEVLAPFFEPAGRVHLKAAQQARGAPAPNEEMTAELGRRQPMLRGTGFESASSVFRALDAVAPSDVYSNLERFELLSRAWSDAQPHEFQAARHRLRLLIEQYQPSEGAGHQFARVQKNGFMRWLISAELLRVEAAPTADILKVFNQAIENSFPDRWFALDQYIEFLASLRPGIVDWAGRELDLRIQRETDRCPWLDDELGPCLEVLVRNQIAKGDFVAAEHSLSLTAKTLAHDAERYFLRGELRRAGGVLATAVTEFDAALDAGYRPFDVLLQRGQTYRALGQASASLEDLVAAGRAANTELERQAVNALLNDNTTNPEEETITQGVLGQAVA